MKYSRFSLRVHPVMLALAALALVSSQYLRWATNAQAATPQTVTIATTQTGTIQTQLSTNNVWAGAVENAPSGQAKLNALNALLIRLHVGDDGGAPAIPQIRTNQWANVGETRPFQNLDTLVNNVFSAGQ